MVNKMEAPLRYTLAKHSSTLLKCAKTDYYENQQFCDVSLLAGDKVNFNTNETKLISHSVNTNKKASDQ